MRVAVIGGGPAGLTTLKYLVTAHHSLSDVEPIEATLFEASSSIGGTFRHRTYENAEMVSSRQLTTFSDFRIPGAPDFLSTDDYCSYLELYCHRFELWQYIKLSTTVLKLERTGLTGHLVTYEQEGKRRTYSCDAVAICTGLHDVPNIPNIKGLNVIPEVLHSSQFKQKAQFGVGKNVLILGTGETGMDIAHMAVTSETKSVTLCHRDGFHVAMKRAPQPVWFGMKSSGACEKSTPNLDHSPPQLELSYAHPWLKGSGRTIKNSVSYDIDSASLLDTTCSSHWRSRGGGQKNTNNSNVPYDVGSASLFETAYAHPWLSGKSKSSVRNQTVPYDVGSASLFETAYAHPWLSGKQPASEKLNVPYDVGSASLFETAYAHPWLQKSRLAAIPWAYYDRFTKWTVALISGTRAGLDQWCGEISPERYHASKIFFNKSTKAMPYISAPYRKESVSNTLRSFIVQMPIPDTKGRQIDLAPWPTHIDDRGVVHFCNNGRPEYEVMKDKTIKPDIIILATGYSQSLTFLDDAYPGPYEADMRSIWKNDDESVGYIGFVRPSFGAIPPLAELQAQLWVLAISGKLVAPLQIEDHYRLNHSSVSRIQYGVDHESYAYQLACDIGSAPNFSHMLGLGWKSTLSWALSANVNPKFRLVGPWKWDGAQEVMEGEIWETVTRRRLIWGHLTLAIMPILIFGTASAILLTVEYAILVVVVTLALPRCAIVWTSSMLHTQSASGGVTLLPRSVMLKDS